MRLSDEAIIQKLSRRIRWDWFWIGYTQANYEEGKQIAVAVLESPNETAVFLGEMGEYVVFDGGGSIRDSRRFSPTTNESVVEEYLRTGEQERVAMTERSFTFALPKLEPPEAVRRGEAPGGLAEFESAVRRQARDWYSTSCGPGELSIPYFSADDPIVLVLAEFGECGTGILDLNRLSNGQWQAGRFWPHAVEGSPAAALPGADDWSYTIQQIRKNRLATIAIQ